MPKKTKKNSGPTLRDMEDMLASDDELPDDCNEEVSDIPAFKLDYRFDEIEFPWLQKMNVKYFNEDYASDELSWSSLNESSLDEKTLHLQNGERVLVTRGVLKKTDLFSLKQMIDSKPGDATIIWFIQFLIYKDLQSSYSFLRSCLVDVNSEHNINNMYNPNASTKHNFYISLL